MYGHDPMHTFSTTSGVTTSNVANLAVAWQFATGDAVSATPTVVGGTVYVGSWDGYFYALDAASGKLAWKLQVDCQPAILPIPKQCLAPGQMEPDRTNTDGGIITSTATVTGGRVYFGSGRTVYCVDAASGKVVWKHVVCGNPDDPQCASDMMDPNEIWSSPAMVDGKIIVGTSVDGAMGYRGGIVALDQSSGAQLWRLEIDPKLDASGNPLPTGGQNRGCGDVWSSGAVDTDDGLVVFGTADCQSAATPPYHEAVLGIDYATGQVKWAYRPNMNTNMCDFDFGASANLMTLGGKRMLGIGSKDGTYYVLDTSGHLVWSKNVVFGGSAGGFIGTAAFDGAHIYGGTAFGDFGGMLCVPSDPRDMGVEDPSFHAFDAATGKVLWETTHAYTFGATTVTNGVLFSGVGEIQPPALRAYDASNGNQLAEVRFEGAVNSGAAVVGKLVYVGTGNSNNGGGGGVAALTVP